MRTLVSAILLTGTLMSASFAENTATEAALTPLGETFARGFYARDPDMVLSVVHPELSKIGVARNFRGSGTDITEELPPGTLEVLGRIYNADGRLSVEHSTVGIDFFDSAENVGVFQLTADRDWYDFFLGTQINGEWVLVNCAYGGFFLIDNPARDADMQAVSEVVRSYARGWDQGRYDQIEAALYPNADRRHVVRGDGPEYLQHETLETIRMDVATGRTARSESQVTVFEANRQTAAARIDADDRTEWVFLQRLNGNWRIVNMFWEARSAG